MAHKLPDYLAQLPNFGERVMILLADGRIDSARYSAVLTPPLSDGTWPWRLAYFEADTCPVPFAPSPTHWARFPEEESPLWQKTPPGGMAEGQSFLALHDNGHISVRRWTTEPIAFPGLLGGEHIRYETVIAWMQLRDENKFSWRAVPEELRKLPSLYDWRMQQQAEWVARRGPDLALSVINEGDTYRAYFQSLCDGSTIWRGGYSVRMDDLVRPSRARSNIDRRNLALGIARSAIQRFLAVSNFKSLYLEEDTGDGAWAFDWTAAVQVAAPIVLDHYVRNYEDGLRAKEASNGK